MPAGPVGRDAELALLGDALAARPERLNAVIVEGRAGIGKTTLLRHLFDEYVVGPKLAARPVAAEAELTFAVLGDLLGQVSPDALTGLPPPQQAALDAALLRAGDGTAPNGRVLGTALHTVLRRLADAGDGPLLLVIDDAQWADRASCAALGFAVRRLDDHPVLLVVAERTDTVASDPLDLNRALSEPPRHIRLGPLSLSALFHVIRDHTGIALARPMLARITDESGGNPLYALELARALAAQAAPARPGEPLPVPDSLEGLIQSRLAGTPGEWAHVLLALALSTEPSTDDLERAVPGAASALAKAHNAGLIEWRGDRVRFAHPLFAAGVSERADPESRRMMHRTLAAIAGDPERRARHLALAATGPDESIATALTDAAAAAARRGAWGPAAELIELAERATPVTDRVAADRRMLLRGEYLARAGDGHGADDALAELLDRVGTGEFRARALELRARVGYPTTGGEAPSIAWCDEALGLVADPALEARIRATRAALVSYIDLDQAVGDAERALELLDATTEPDPIVFVTAVMALNGCRFELGEPLPTDLIERAIELEREHPNPDVGDRLGPALGSQLKYAGRLSEARPLLLAGHRAALDEGDDGSLPYAVSHLPQLELWAGRVGEAERWAVEHLTLAEHTGQDAQRISALYNLAQVHTHQGRFADAEAELDAADAIAAENDTSWTDGPLAGARGYLHLLRGEFEPAIEQLLRSAGVFVGIGSRRPRRGDCDLAEALIRGGHVAEAFPVIDRLEAAARRSEHHDLLGGALACRALVAAAEQRLDDALSMIEAAIGTLQRGEEPLAMGRAVLVMGQIRRRRGERRLAIDALTEAERIFDAIGAVPWAAQAAAERARIPVRQRAGSGLTEGEERIALAAARGLTNQQIAAELFVSVKTVEASLTRAYAKLGVRSRAELATRFATTQPPTR
jgi:DNA-binding CsgD family transcriptional regulator